jgi:septum formation protein
VRFRELTEAMIEAYIETKEPFDKAGAYGAQGYAAPYIEAIEGDFFNVVGLPLCALGRLLEKLGIAWWQVKP